MEKRNRNKSGAKWSVLSIVLLLAVALLVAYGYDNQDKENFVLHDIR